MKVPLRQKIFLVFASIIIVIVLIEGGLRLGGFIFFKIQDRQNKINLADANEYRILCIGESTTALGGENSYPAQLERILNKNSSGKKFNVINKGLPNKTTDDIIKDLPRSIQTYQPHVIVAMMGANDKSALKRPYIVRLLERFYTVKFTWWLYQGLQIKLKPAGQQSGSPDETKNPLDKILKKSGSTTISSQEKMDEDSMAVLSRELENLNKNKEYLHRKKSEFNGRVLPVEEDRKFEDSLKLIDLKRSVILSLFARYDAEQGNFTAAEEKLLNIIKEAPYFYTGYLELGRVYRMQKKYEQAIFMFSHVIKINKNIYEAHAELGDCWLEMGYGDDAYKAYQPLLAIKFFETGFYTRVGRWFYDRKKYDYAVEFFARAYEINKKDYLSMQMLADSYAKLGDMEKAKLYEQESKTRQSYINTYAPMTVKNYQGVAHLSLKSGAVFISMQYPMRSIAPLKDVLKASQEKIVFVENKEMFEETLKQARESEIFSDKFAGDFGHCTVKGNRLIAENLAESILKLF